MKELKSKEIKNEFDYYLSDYLKIIDLKKVKKIEGFKVNAKILKVEIIKNQVVDPESLIRDEHILEIAKDLLEQANKYKLNAKFYKRNAIKINIINILLNQVWTDTFLSEFSD